MWNVRCNMQVSSVSNSFNPPSFRASREEQAFSRLDDSDLRKMAYAKASNDVNDKKHRRIDKALYYSLPLAGGLVAVAGGKFSGKYARINRLGVFGAVAGVWALGLAALNAVWGVKDVAAKTSGKAKEFFDNHQLLTNIGLLAAGIGAITAVDKYTPKALKAIKNFAAKRLDEKSKVRIVNSANEKLERFANGLNTNKYINKAVDFLKSAPAPIKATAKAVADWAPWIVIGTQLAHSFGHENVKAKETIKEYDNLKTAQQIVRDDIADEKIKKDVNKMTIKDLHKKYEQMLAQNPIMDVDTDEPITFKQFVQLATAEV